MSNAKPQMLRGVNLGGWLVVEKWMTPSLFAGTQATDQYTLARTPEGLERLRVHYESFMTEADFVWLKDHGITAVRVPIGFWAVDDQPPLANVRERLDWLFVMAMRYNIAVLLCLHAAPGSQNGHDHSGRVGRIEWYKPQNRAKTFQVLASVAQRYSGQPNLWGIELLNEPQVGSPWRFLQLLRWSRQTARQLTQRFPDIRIVYSDGFRPCLWTGKVRGVMDVHHYQAFSRGDKRRTIVSHLQKVAHVATKIMKWQYVQPVIIGEWSLGIDDTSLHGVERATAEKQFADAQLAAYAHAAGWFFWSYKTEQADGWNYRAQVENGQLPVNAGNV